MSEKEAWPGSGFDYDLKKLKSEDAHHHLKCQEVADELFEMIEQQASQLPNTQARKMYYELASAEIHHASEMDPHSYGAASFAAIKVYDKCRSARALQILRLEQEAARQPAEETVSVDDSTTAGRVMAVYYLLLAAGADYGLNKSRMGRLVCFLTDEKYSTIKRYWQNPLGNPDSEETRKNRELIRKLFDDLGLKKALELMDKD